MLQGDRIRGLSLAAVLRAARVEAPDPKLARAQVFLLLVRRRLVLCYLAGGMDKRGRGASMRKACIPNVLPNLDCKFRLRLFRDIACCYSGCSSCCSCCTHAAVAAFVLQFMYSYLDDISFSRPLTSTGCTMSAM